MWLRLVSNSQDIPLRVPSFRSHVTVMSVWMQMDLLTFFFKTISSIQENCVLNHLGTNSSTRECTTYSVPLTI